MIIYLIALSSGVMIFSMTWIKFSSFEEHHNQVKTRLNRIQTASQKGMILDEEFSKPLAERFLKPFFHGLAEKIQKFLPEEKTGQTTLQKKQANRLKVLLRQAGMKVGVNQYLKIRLLVLAVSFAGFALLGFFLSLGPFYTVLLGMLGAYAAYVILRFQLASRITSRRNAMQRQLPEVLDMLSVSVEAGLGLEQAMIQVVNHFDGPLIDEIAVANREMAMGRNRKDALLMLGDRCDIQEMKNFVRAIVQSSQLGISIKNVLRAQSSLMRQTRKNKVEEKAMKVSVKILLPMAFFIFPVLFIVLLGPAVASIAENIL